MIAACFVIAVKLDVTTCAMAVFDVSGTRLLANLLNY